MSTTQAKARDTARYTRFARSAAGFSNVAAGGLCLAAYFLATIVDAVGLWARASLAATPLVWIGVKELLGRRYLARHGCAAPEIGARDRVWHVLFTVVSVLVGVMVIVVAVMSRGDGSFPAGRALPLWLYVAFGVATPFAIARYIRTIEESLVGVFLVAQAALLLAGGVVPLGGGAQMPIFALIAIGLGVKQHIDYRAVENSAPGRETARAEER